ncbi:MAG: Tad domain-containing protein [Leptolyngbya sp.]|nr:Tad domain-containing protein [Candidatus Melainabacteria bacterium]
MNVLANSIRKKQHVRKQGVRKQRGNMIVLGSLVLGVVGMALMLGYSYGGLLFVHNRLQSTADEVALAGSRKLNDGDRIGQMNNMLARSRQLVFYSRQQLDDASEKYPQLQTIADELLQESREGAQELEGERKKLKVVAQSEALTAMINKFDQVKGSYPMALPWLKVATPKLTKMRLGCIEEMNSNVVELKNIPALENYDKGQGYVSNNPGMKLYKHGVDMKLPGADSDLTFKIAALAAPVEKTVSPARITLANTYKAVNGAHIPSSTQVTLDLEVGTGLGAKAENKMSATGTAASTGASTQQ